MPLWLEAHLGPSVSAWFAAVLRGDAEPISVGASSNVQDGAILHTDLGFPIEVGEECTIGDRAFVHGCIVDDGCLIGVAALVMNGARIGAGSIIGAGAIVISGMIVPPLSLVVVGAVDCRLDLTPLCPQRVRSVAINSGRPWQDG